jgi:NAD(P)-dependent dehydrogenase (short-subunit alcohol dehydrogenase family)
MRMKPEQWQEVIDTNLTGVFYCTQARTLVDLFSDRCCRKADAPAPGPRAGGVQADGQAQVRAHHQHHVRCGPLWKCWAGQLRVRQGACIALFFC